MLKVLYVCVVFLFLVVVVIVCWYQSRDWLRRLSQQTGCKDCLWNDLLCIKWVLDSPHLNRIIRIIGTISILSGTVGLAQGIRRIFVQFGLILGPLWAGSMLYQPYYMFSVMLAINLLLMVCILSIFCPLYDCISLDHAISGIILFCDCRWWLRCTSCELSDGRVCRHCWGWCGAIGVLPHNTIQYK